MDKPHRHPLYPTWYAMPMSTDEIVTEEMLAASVTAYTAAAHATAMPEHTKCIAVAIRAVAPMIAARVDPYKRREREHIERAIEAEREACAKIAAEAEPIVAARGTTTDRNLTRLMAHKIAAAIRARGETI
jgi:hypothetical protein